MKTDHYDAVCGWARVTCLRENWIRSTKDLWLSQNPTSLYKVSFIYWLFAV